MSASLTLAAIWAVLATVVALLPMRRQYLPGFALVASAPLVLGYLGWQHGAWVVGLGVLAFISMFRKPLLYFARRALGRPAHHSMPGPIPDAIPGPAPEKPGPDPQTPRPPRKTERNGT